MSSSFKVLEWTHETGTSIEALKALALLNKLVRYFNRVVVHSESRMVDELYDRMCNFPRNLLTMTLVEYKCQPREVYATTERDQLILCNIKAILSEMHT